MRRPRWRSLLRAVCILALGACCLLADDALISWTPLAPSATRERTPLFESLSAQQTGIDLVYSFPTNAPPGLLQDQGCAAGVCLGDFDGDGKPDLFLTHYNRGNRLYRNLGNWRFENVTRKAGVEAAGRWCAGATFVDIDNDGDLDLFVCVFNAPNLLFVNQGNGVFKEEAERFGLNFRGASVMMAFADYDRDGRLDAYLVTHRLNLGTDHRLPASSRDAFGRSIVQVKGGQVQVAPAYRELFAIMGKGQGRTELIIAGQQDYLYHNDGGNRFRIVNPEAGIDGQDIGLAAAWWDYNDDGFPDLYVSNDYKGPDRLYRNNQDGTFTDVAASALPHVPWSSMGSDSADLDNDGRIDFMATEMAGSTHQRRMSINGDILNDRWFLLTGAPRQYQRNAIYLATGTEHLLEAAFLTGLDSTDWTWSPKFADLDNDGWVDLFICNGMSRDFVNADVNALMRDRSSRSWRDLPVLREENLAFRNSGDLRFEPVGRAWGLNTLSASFGAAFGDLDGDGDLDLVVSNFNEPVSVYRNQGTAGHRLLVRLKGRQSNSWGIGAKLQLTTAAGLQTRYLSLASGIMSANEPIAHFGLGDHTQGHRLTIQWPSGREQSVTHLLANRSYTVTEAPSLSAPSRPSAATWFQRTDLTAAIRHREADFNDFEREPLLPWKLSQLGPGLAVADVDGDGDEDFYLGGAAGQAGMLCLNDGYGRFQLATMPCLATDAAAEDLGALFFDADYDGDCDLFVVSGGVEYPIGSPLLRDRLYLNDGRGRFQLAPEGTLPDLRDSGSVVAAADFDRDGDLDLFIGSRVMPGRYPDVPGSRLLRNERGKFVEVTTDFAPILRGAGLVTSAIWSDANGDGWPDLLLTREWGTVALLINQRGRLVDQTAGSGLENHTGWWNGITAVDIDSDGDLDYLATNFGLNTGYRADLNRPALAYVMPFDEREQLVEAYFEGGTLFPVRRRELLSLCMPSLLEKFPTYRSFASAPLAEIFPPDRLDRAARLAATSLESALLINDGHGRFTVRPLPRMAQIAPAFGVVSTELNGDGHPDVCLAHNFFSPQPETGRMDGGLGQILAGVEGGALELIPAKTSGLVIPGDAKSLAATDLNGDGRPDLIVGRNDAQPLVFTNITDQRHRIASVRLQGLPGNPTAIGALVRVTLTDGSRQQAEVHAGGGYLSQSTGTLFFGLGLSNTLSEVQVRWPDGNQSVHQELVSGLKIVIPAKDRGR